MPYDSLWASSHVTRDIFFNNENDSLYAILQFGNVDLDVYCSMESNAAAGDTIVIDMYGIKLKKRSGNTAARGYTLSESFLFDSTYVGTVIIDSASNNHESFALDAFFQTMPMYDGIRLSYKKSSVDADSVNIWGNFKISQAQIRQWSPDPRYESMGFDTATYVSGWDTLSLGDTYDKINLYLDDVSIAVYAAVDGDTLHATRHPAGSIWIADADISSVIWKAASGNPLVVVNKYKRRRW
jgi:hypothetical protein